MKTTEFRKLIREEVRKVMKEATNPVESFVEDIVDLASSGAGVATGLQSKELVNLVNKIKASNLTNAVDKALVKYINNTDEAFTEDDIEALRAVGFKMSGVDYNNLGYS